MCTFNVCNTRKGEIGEFVGEYLLGDSSNPNVAKAFEQAVDYIFSASIPDSPVSPNMVVRDFDVAAMIEAIRQSWKAGILKKHFRMPPAAIPMLVSMLADFQLRRRTVAEAHESVFTKELLIKWLDVEQIRTPSSYRGLIEFLNGISEMLKAFSRSEKKLPRLSRIARKEEFLGYNYNTTKFHDILTFLMVARKSIAPEKQWAWTTTHSKRMGGLPNILEQIENRIILEWQRPEEKSVRIQQMQYFLQAYEAF